MKKIIDVVVRYIEENYNKEIGLNDAAAIVFITPNYLSELFSREKGCSFKEYIIQKRIEIAKKLLCDLEYSIGDIAKKIGYGDEKHFSKLFKKYTGVTPSEFRKLFL